MKPIERLRNRSTSKVDRFSVRLAALTGVAAALLLACQIVIGPTPAAPPPPTLTPRAASAPTARVEGVPDFACTKPHPAAAGFGYGIQSQYAVGDIGYWNRVIAEKLGLNWVKAQVRWRDFEPVAGAYATYKFALLDVFIKDANERGLNILLSVVDAPFDLRSAYDPRDPDRLGPPDDTAEAVRFFGLLARRYRGCAQAIEIWNESNLAREWTTPRTLSAGRPDAAEFAAFLGAVGQTLKRIDPDLIVIAGGLAPTGANGPQSRDDIVYLGELTAAGGLSAVDCVGAHLNGFNLPPDQRHDAGYNDPTAGFRGPFDNPHHSWSVQSTLDAYRRISPKPICVTEFGWATMENLGVAGAPPGFGFALDNTEAEQAAWIVRAFELMREGGAVRLAIVFNLDYIAKAGTSAADDSSLSYSLIRKNGVPRPAFDALERMPKRP